MLWVERGRPFDKEPILAKSRARFDNFNNVSLEEGGQGSHGPIAGFLFFDIFLTFHKACIILLAADLMQVPSR